MTSSQIVINLTSSTQWRRRPVGIIRVERELAKQLIKLAERSIRFVSLDRSTNRFVCLEEGLVHSILSDSWVECDDPDTAAELPISDTPFRPRNNEIFVSAGSDWSYNVPAIVHSLYQGQRVLVPACYDLIPLLYPEYTPDKAFYQQFKDHYTTIAAIARSVFAISSHSKRDLLKFWETERVKTCPAVHAIPLAGMNRSDLATADPPQEYLDRYPELGSGNFVLYVSTIEPRKNHTLLLDIWEALHAKHDATCPILVFVGMRGWGSQDLIDRLHRLPAYKAGKIVWREGVDDSGLQWFYRFTQFCVFPSVYEGWGLAATEALSFGKACIVSSSSSLQEATSNTMPALHPYDYFAWLKTIESLIFDSGQRKLLEERARRDHQTRTWDDFGKSFCEQML